jgi:ATP-dependent Lon protease
MEFPHLAGIAGDVANFVAGGSAASLRPILLVGPAGIGKDSILRRAAELVGRPIGEYDVAGSSDSRIIKGTSKGWSSASPGFPASICARYLCANPFLVFSELDRAGGSRRNGQVNEAFLGLCEPSTRRRLFDDGLGTELDLSEVAVAFTSNGVADTPGPLLTRLRIIQLEPPKPEHVSPIVQQARRRLANELKVPLEAITEPAPEVLRRLEAIAQNGRFQLRLADRIVRALGPSAPQSLLN